MVRADSRSTQNSKCTCNGATRTSRTPQYHEQLVTVAGRRVRQLHLQDLGHDEPTTLLTNEHRPSLRALITRYAQRMLIDNALSDAVRFFHMDGLSSAVGGGWPSISA